jgi:predicted phosphodiesterase
VRIAVLSDVHGNPVALDACLARLDGLDVDERVFLGDVVGYLPGEVACLRALRAEGFACLQGNHEAMLLAGSATGEDDAVYGHEQAAWRLGADGMRMLAGWPQSRTVDRDGLRLLFVHGAPGDPLEGYVYPDADLSGWDSLPYDAVFMGHTHRPFARRSGRVLVANAGSVGLPRDAGSVASFAVFDGDSGDCVHVRVPFDADEVVRRAGPGLHPATVACLRRPAREVVGEVLA